MLRSKMADEEDTPPPPPSSPLPIAEALDDLQENELQPRTFASLQKMLSSSKTMYSDPGHPPLQRSGLHSHPGDPDPPTKRCRASVDEELLAGESPKLTHQTRNRPKRKVRVPSKSMLKAMKSQSSGVVDVSIDEDSTMSESASTDVFPPDMPPPPPDSAPPVVSSDPPPSLASHHKQQIAEVVGSSSSVGIIGASQKNDEGGTPSLNPTANKTLLSLSLGQAPAKQLPSNSDIDENEDTTITVKLASASTVDTASIPPATSEAIRSQAVVIGSFSERLRKIREKHTIGASSTLSPTKHPPVTSTNASDSFMFNSLGDTLSSHKPATASPIQSASLASPLFTSLLSTPSQTSMTPSATDAPRVLRDSNSATKVFPISPKSTPLDFNLESFNATSKQNKGKMEPDLFPLPDDNRDKDSSPLEILAESGEENTPPPLPPSPPPKSPKISRSSPVVSDKVLPLPAANQSQSSSHSKREGWKKKRQELDSLMSEPLPRLIHASKLSEAPTEARATAVMEVEGAIPENRNTTATTFEAPDSFEAPMDDSSFKSSSSTSLPSLPDSPPPELPTSPPPELPTSPPPDSTDIAAESGELVIIEAVDLGIPSPPPMDSDGAEKEKVFISNQSPLPGLCSRAPNQAATTAASDATTVKLRHPQPNQSERRISAFDALVATEPDVEERREPKLSISDRRSLALQAARRPDADTQQLLQRWSVHMNESAGTQLPSDSRTEMSPNKVDSLDGRESEATTATPTDALDSTIPSQNSGSLPSNDDSSQVLQFKISKGLSPQKHDTNTSSIRNRSNSEIGAAHRIRKHPARFRQSVPLSSDDLQKVKIISEDGVMHSPDIKYTRITKRRWRKQQQEQRIFDDLSSSASTGDIIPFAILPESKIQETTSLRSFGSSSESLSLDDTQRPKPGSQLSPLVVSQMKKPSSELSEELVRSEKELDGSRDAIIEQKQTDDQGMKRQSSGLLDSVLTDISSRQSSGAQSLNSSREDLLRENNAPVLEEVVMESTEILEATPPPPTHPPPSSAGGASIRANGGVRGKKRKIRSVNSMINEASIHRKVLEEQLQGPMSDELASLGRLQHEQGQLLEQQLAQIREQQKMTHHLLGGNQSPWDSPRALHPPSMYLDRDSLESDPDKWSVEEVCQWLELVGLGMYRQAFRERDVNGATLLRMDVQLFAELGIDSPEIREIFLARIYELSNPAAYEGDMEDDFPLSVASYTSDDLRKLQAAVNALKSPVLGDSIELEPSAIGQFLLKDHVRSQSTPNIAELDLEDRTAKGPHGLSGIVTSPTVHSFPHYALINASENYTPKDHTSMNASSGMPMAVMRAQIRTRERSHTTPTALRVMAMQSSDEEEMEQREKPLTVSKMDKGNVEDNQARSVKVEKLEPTREQPRVPKPDASVLQLAKDLSEGSITFEGGQFRTTKQGDHSLVSMTPGFWEQPPTGQESGIVRLFMDTVQKGALYKAFLVTSSTMAEQLIKQALDKANMVEDPHSYCIYQAAVAPYASSRVLLPQECPLTLQTQWPSYNSHRFELRMGGNVRRLKITVELPGRRREELLVSIATTTTCSEVIQLLLSKIHLLEEWEGKEDGIKCAMVEVDPTTKAERVLGDEECPVVVQSSWKDLHKLKLISLSDTLTRHSTEADTEISSIQKEVDTDSPALLAHIQTLEQKNLFLRQQLDSAHLNLQQHQELEHKMSSLHDAHLSLLNELQRQEKSHQLKVHTLQQKVDELMLSNRKLEDQLRVSTSGEEGEENWSNLLDEIQARYSQEVSELTGTLREKERILQELRTKKSAVEEELSVLQGRSTELDQLSRQMSERNQQIRAFERDLATKEDTIHRLRARLEETQVTNDQVIALEKSLKAVETTSQQQQDFAGHTICELQGEVAHLTREVSRKEELLRSLGKERERATRDQQAKDALISTLESNLECHKVLGSPAANKEAKIQVLEQSLGAHERALGLLRGEYRREQTELREAKEEMENLRAVIASKDEQLSHLSTSQGTERPLLYPLVASGHPQLLVAAQVDPSEHGLGLKVTNASSKVGGCVVKEVADFCSAKEQLNPGDRLLEINGSDVSSKTRQEVGEFLQQCHGVVKLVVGRLQPTFGAIGGSLTDLYGVESRNGMVIERFKKLNASLSAQLDSRSAEVERWRQESERLKAEVSRHSTAQKDKDSELKYLQSTVQDLKQQLRESDRSRAQLRHTLEEVDSSRQDEQHSEALETRLREKTREVTMLRATEKERLGQLKKLQMKRDSAVKMLRQHLVSSDTSELPEEEVELQSKVLTHATQSEVLASLCDTEEELQRHKNYLDQLLSIVIDSNPELLAKMGEAQRTRDQLESDNWC